MIGLDTSFLVGLTDTDHPAHGNCMTLFESSIRGQLRSAALAPQVMTEFAHVITDARRFRSPLSMDEALGICEDWWNSTECMQIEPDANAANVFMDWMRCYRLGRKRLLDTMLAATYFSAGVRSIATTNWRDFGVFEVFDIRQV